MWPVKQGWVRTREKYQTENADREVGTCEVEDETFFTSSCNVQVGKKSFPQEILRSWQLCGALTVCFYTAANTQLFLSKSKIHNSKSPFPKIQLTDSLIAEDVCVCVFGLYPWQHNNTHTHTHVRKWQWHRSFPNGATVTSWNLPPMSTLTVWNRTRRDGWGQALLSVSTHKHVWAACVRRVGRDGVSAFSSG